MKDKVDILLSVYNTDINYLRKQVDSILNQNYRNFKLIISDDCSPSEDVRDVLKEYEYNDDRIELYFQEKNLGCTKSFEFLLEKSTAEYIAFSDHDDVWYPNKIEESIKVLKEKNVDLVYCDAKQINSKGDVIHESYLRYKHLPIINETYNKNMIRNSILPFSRHIAIGCSQLFTKKVKQLMLPFTENVIAHDWHSLYIANRLKGIYCIDKQLFEYRIHENNIFGGKSFKQNLNIWKEKHGNNYKSYLDYRYHAITETYLSGVLMCKDYSDKLDKIPKLEKEENDVINYFKTAQKHKIIYLPIHKYIKYLNFKGCKSRALREIVILHFSILGYIIFKLI